MERFEAMDMITPVRSANYPTQRSTRRTSSGLASGYAQAETADWEEPVSLRPSHPLANASISMLLEILSEAGTPVNGNDGLQGGSYELRRRRDDNRLNDGARNQYSLFDFFE